MVIFGFGLILFPDLTLCSHFIVPELGPTIKFTYASHKAVSEYKEAKAVCCYLPQHCCGLCTLVDLPFSS
jgi:hypothetical protein